MMVKRVWSNRGKQIVVYNVQIFIYIYIYIILCIYPVCEDTLKFCKYLPKSVVYALNSTDITRTCAFVHQESTGMCLFK